MSRGEVVPVSVAIPCFQGRERLLRTLGQIAQCDPAPAEVLIHADGGWALELPVDRAWPWPVHVLHSQTAIGPGGGRQRMIEAAECDVVASFDDDSWPVDKDYFARALVLMNAFSQAAVLSPAVSLPDEPGIPVLAEVWEARGYEGCASIHRRSLHLQLPGFVPVAAAYGLEEADIALQARTHGMQVLATAWMSAWHERPRSDAGHALGAWIRNELVLGWLRYPTELQLWAVWRALRRLWRDAGKAGALSLIRSALTAPAMCAALKGHRARATWSGVMNHHRGPLRAWRIDAGQMKEVPARGTVLFAQFTEPAAYPPLEHATRILADHGWQVLCVGLSTGMMRLPAHPRIRCMSSPRAAGGWRTKLQFASWSLKCFWQAWRTRTEWVYASDPFAALPGLMIQSLLRKKVVYHEHDSPPDNRSGLFLRMIQWCRRRLGRSAEAVVLPSAGRMEVFKKMAAPRGVCEVVWNVPSTDEVLAEPRVPLAGGLRVVFHGSVVPERFPLTYVELLLKCREAVTMEVMGYEPPGAVGYKQRLMDHAAKLGLSHRFRCLPAVAFRTDLLKCCRTYDVGLALLARREWDLNSIHMAGASNKPFDYASQGLAVLVPDEPEWRQLYVESGCALACAWDDMDGIARALNHLHDHPDELRAMGEHGRQLCLKNWNYDQQFAPVVDLIESVMQPRITS